MKFQGRVICFSGDAAIVELEDTDGEHFIAECRTERLSSIGCSVGDRFECNFEENGWRYTKTPRRIMTLTRQRQIRKEVEALLA